MNINLRDILMSMNPCDIHGKRLILWPLADGNAVRYVEIAADTAWRRREQFHPLVDWGVTPKTRICCLSILTRRGRLKGLKLSLQARMPRLRAPPVKGRQFEQYTTAACREENPDRYAFDIRRIPEENQTRDRYLSVEPEPERRENPSVREKPREAVLESRRQTRTEPASGHDARGVSR